MADYLLCAADELGEQQTKGFELECAGKPLSLFVVRQNGRLYAYRNRCPHTGAPLEWQPDQFLDYCDQFIQCSIHGALFQINDGYCLRGPCLGASLSALEVTEENGKIILSCPSA